jgi:hypothetical protein
MQNQESFSSSSTGGASGESPGHFQETTTHLEAQGHNAQETLSATYRPTVDEMEQLQEGRVAHDRESNPKPPPGPERRNSITRYYRKTHPSQGYEFLWKISVK